MKTHPKILQFLNGPLFVPTADATTTMDRDTAAAAGANVNRTIGGQPVYPAGEPKLAVDRSGRPRHRFPSESITISFDVRHENGPALVAAIEEIRNEIGERLTAPHKFAKEDALTRAAAALLSLHAGLSAAGYTVSDADYR